MTKVVKATLEDHPFYTFFPQVRNIVKDSIKGKIITNYLLPIMKIMVEQQQYGTLIMDDCALQIISTLFASTELTEMRLVMKEKLHFARESSHKNYGIYIFQPTQQNVERIAQDFGYDKEKKQKVPTLQEIKDIRMKEDCCIKPNRFYNPYHYRGLFLLPLDELNIEWINATNLNVILGEPKYTPMNIQFIPRESHYFDLMETDSFKTLYSKTSTKSDLKNYIHRVSQKINQVFQYCDVSGVNIFYQKFSNDDVCKQIATETQQISLKNNKTSEKATLFVLERAFDPFSLCSYNFTYGPLLTDLLNLNDYMVSIETNEQKKLTKKELEKQREMETHGVKIEKQEPVMEKRLRKFNIGESDNLVFNAVRTKFFIQAQEDILKAQKQLSQIMQNQQDHTYIEDDVQKLFTQLQDKDFSSIQVIFNTQNIMFKNIEGFQDYIKTQMDKFLKLIFDCEKVIFSVQAGYNARTVADLFQHKLEDGKQMVQAITQSLQRNDFQPEIAIRLLMLILMTYHASRNTQFQDQIKALIDGIEKSQQITGNLKTLVRTFQYFYVQKSNMKVNYCNVIEYYKELSSDKKQVKFKSFIDEDYMTQVIPSVIDIICRLIDQTSNSKIIDQLFQSVSGTPFDKSRLQNKVVVNLEQGVFSHEFKKELELAKARFYAEADSSRAVIQQQYQEDKESFQKKNKIFFYIAGGATYSEISACLKNSINFGKLGVFNKGSQYKNTEFYLISDFWGQPMKFLNIIAEEYGNIKDTKEQKNQQKSETVKLVEEQPQEQQPKVQAKKQK